MYPTIISEILKNSAEQSRNLSAFGRSSPPSSVNLSAFGQSFLPLSANPPASGESSPTLSLNQSAFMEFENSPSKSKVLILCSEKSNNFSPKKNNCNYQ